MKIEQRKYINDRRKKRRRRVCIIERALIGIGIVALLLMPHAWKAKPVKSDRLAETNSDVVHETERDDKTDVPSSGTNQGDVMQKLGDFAEQNGFSINEYPEELIELLRKNPETEEFVLNYPLKKNEFSTESLNELIREDSVPLLMQWDSRWGYYQYGDNVMGLTGCGPTCLSMVAIHLLQNPQLTPAYMADYSIRNGYCVPGSGTSWELMSLGAENLGLNAEEVPLNENTVKRYLQDGNPIICIMGKGDFTDEGHFIVLTGLKDGKIEVNDPNSRERSEKLWEFENIKRQIRNMWVYEK